MKSNKSAGTAFEREMAQLLHQNGFWVHRFRDNVNGQPCDLIAVRSGCAYLIDCKDCRKGVFPFSRIEENQENAMRAFERAYNEDGLFALRMPAGEDREDRGTDGEGGGIYMLKYKTLIQLRYRRKTLSRSDCGKYGKLFEDWEREA